LGIAREEKKDTCRRISGAIIAIGQRTGKIIRRR